MQLRQIRHHAPRDEPNHQLPATKSTVADHLVALRITAEDLPTPPPVFPAGRPPGRLITSRRAGMMVTLGGILLLIAGILIRVKTDTGTLIIECSNSSIPVKIRQGTETVDRQRADSFRRPQRSHSSQRQV